jgi:hypothetical protein
MLWPTPQTDVLKRIMKINPKKKKAKPPPREEVAVEGANSVTPSAKKKNQSGVLMNSPRTQAGYRT